MFDSIGYAIIEEEGGDSLDDGKESPIYVSIPAAASLSLAQNVPRDHRDDKAQPQEDCYQSLGCYSYVDMKYPILPSRSNVIQQHSCSRQIANPPRDVSRADPILSSSSSRFARKTFASTTAILPHNAAEPNSSTHEGGRYEYEVKSPRQRCNQPYHNLPSYHHDQHHHPHQSQSQGSLGEDYYYYCFDENTFLDSDLWKEEGLQEPLYSFLPFPTEPSWTSSSSFPNRLSNCPVWSASPSKVPSVAIPRATLRHPTRRLVIGSSTFFKYLSDIFEASSEFQAKNNKNTMGLGDLSQDQVYNKLIAYWKENGSKLDMRDLFKNDPERFKKFR